MSARAPTPVQSIRRRGKTPAQLDFAALRLLGIEHLQALSGQRWTDFNIHDPGLTILEQLCYALSEILYRGEAEVADLLTGADGAIDFERLSLHPPHVVFPCRPATLHDYRCVLLAAVAGVDDVKLHAVRTRSQRRGRRDPQKKSLQPAGLYHLLVRPARGASVAVRESIREARSAYLAQRNLGEDLDRRATVIEDVPCVLHASLELGGTRDPIDVLAEVYLRCDEFITARIQACAFETLAAQRSLADVFDGPALPGRCFDAASFAAADAAALFIGHLAAVLQSVPGLARVERIALQCGDAEPASGTVQWRGPDWALRLQLPEPQDALDAIRLHRGGHELSVPAAAVLARYQDLRAAQRVLEIPAVHWPQVLDLPHGSYRPADRYYSIQHQFPANYGVGQHGIPASASRREQAQMLQLKGYLLLFEQLLANGTEQLHHLRELFSAAGDLARSYWWQMLDTAAVADIEQLHSQASGAIEQAVFAPFDQASERRHRVLDYLLALHGATYSQSTQRQFLGFLEGAALEHHLLLNKAAYLRDIVRLTRDRAAGFDYGHVSWDNPDNCSGLQRRVSLLLGFARPFSRSLTAALRTQNLTLMTAAAATQAAQSGRWMAQPGQVLLPVPASDRELPAASEASRPLLATASVFTGRQINEELFRLGVYRQRYRLVAATGGAYHHLLLGLDEAAGWWHLGDYTSAAAAARDVDALREQLLQLNQDSEGLHLVEHLLLRPVSERRRAEAPDDFYERRLTVVFADWSVRCHQPQFRRLAQQTVELNCPAHLRVRCRWLGFDAMLRFESHYVRWLQAKLIYTRQPLREHARTLDEAARALTALLLELEAATDRQSPPEPANHA